MFVLSLWTLCFNERFHRQCLQVSVSQNKDFLMPPSIKFKAENINISDGWGNLLCYNPNRCFPANPIHLDLPIITEWLASRYQFICSSLLSLFSMSELCCLKLFYGVWCSVGMFPITCCSVFLTQCVLLSDRLLCPYVIKLSR